MTPARRAPEATAERRAELAAAARDIVARAGPGGLTMRSLAAEAGCSVGLVYKVFHDRADLVAAVIAAEYVRLTQGFDALVDAAGTGTIGDNLAAWAALLLDSPAIALARDVADIADVERVAAVTDAVARDVGLVTGIEGSVVDYLTAEQRLGRVATRVDAAAVGFVIAGAVHNLLVAGDLYPRPSRAELRRMLASLGDLVTFPTPSEERTP